MNLQVILLILFFLQDALLLFIVQAFLSIIRNLERIDPGNDAGVEELKALMMRKAERDKDK